MTNEQLVQYLRVCADLADKPGDGIAHVGVGHLRQAIALLSPSDEPKAPLIPVQGARPMDLHQWGDGCATHAGSECVRVYDADAIDALILELSADRPAEPKATLAKTASGGTLRCGQHGLPNEIRGDRIGCRKCFEVNRGAGQ